MSFNTKYVRIDSNDRDTTSNLTNSRSDFVVELKERNEMQRINKVNVHQVWVPNVFYNVRTGVNDTIKITQDGQTQQTITLTQGQYSIASFMVAAKVAIDAALAGGSAVTITQNANTQLLTLAFSGGTNPNTALDVDSAANGWCVFGLSSSSAEAASHTMDSIPNLRGLSQVYLHSKTLNNYGSVDGDSGVISMLTAVSFHDVAFGAMGYFQSTAKDNTEIVYDKPRNISNMQLTLRDSQGNRLDTGCSNITLILKVEIDET